MKHCYLLLFLLIIITSCHTNDDCSRYYNDLVGRQLKFPSNPRWFVYDKDTAGFIPGRQLKIVNHIDSTGCLMCKSQLPLWNEFISELDSLTYRNVDVLLFVSPKRVTDAKVMIKNNSFLHPVCIDISDSISKLNNLPSDNRFQCFLLDSDNRVILVGNPVQSPEIKELYLRAICQSLGIGYRKAETGSSANAHDLGHFPYKEVKTTDFVIRNDSNTEMTIDSVFTSCECTTATINKSVIEPDGSATLSVTFKADKPDSFMREIYLRIGDETKTYTISGVAD